ncbi:MAG: GNAT family N-acetyltransferase [Actinomycetota bacterium]
MNLCRTLACPTGGTPPGLDRFPNRGCRRSCRGSSNPSTRGTIGFSVIVPDGELGGGAGTVCIWDHDWNGERISEIGWMVLPAFQGRGLATAAVRSILQRLDRRAYGT